LNKILIKLFQHFQRHAQVK